MAAPWEWLLCGHLLPAETCSLKPHEWLFSGSVKGGGTLLSGACWVLLGTGRSAETPVETCALAQGVHTPIPGRRVLEGSLGSSSRDLVPWCTQIHSCLGALVTPPCRGGAEHACAHTAVLKNRTPLACLYSEIHDFTWDLLQQQTVSSESKSSTFPCQPR